MSPSDRICANCSHSLDMHAWATQSQSGSGAEKDVIVCVIDGCRCVKEKQADE